ncbi:hypothetical protein [Nocardia brasiliensis]|uniref:hypothetical protein n=1 Tax=Nocardia brasiliensis TaxID=37326 RepID=UPI002453C0EA|nr:hypothetical protein [Nocardia brasiliensis]
MALSWVYAQASRLGVAVAAIPVFAASVDPAGAERGRIGTHLDAEALPPGRPGDKASATPPAHTAEVARGLAGGLGPHEISLQVSPPDRRGPVRRVGVLLVSRSGGTGGGGLSADAATSSS